MDWLDGSPTASIAPKGKQTLGYAASTRVGAGYRARSRVFGAKPVQTQSRKLEAEIERPTENCVEASPEAKSGREDCAAYFASVEITEAGDGALTAPARRITERSPLGHSPASNTPDMTLGKQKGIVASFIKLHGHRRQARAKAIAALGTPDTPDTHDSMDLDDSPASICSGGSGASLRGTPIASIERSDGSGGHAHRSRVFAGGRPNIIGASSHGSSEVEQGSSRPPKGRRERKKRQPLMKWCLAQALAGQSDRRKQRRKGRAQGAVGVLTQALLGGRYGSSSRSQSRIDRGGGAELGATHDRDGGHTYGHRSTAVGREGILAMRYSARDRDRVGAGAGARAKETTGDTQVGADLSVQNKGRHLASDLGGKASNFDAVISAPFELHGRGGAGVAADSPCGTPGSAAVSPGVFAGSAASSPGGASVASAGSGLSIRTDSSQSSGDLISQALEGLTAQGSSRFTSSRLDIQLLRRSSVMPQHRGRMGSLTGGAVGAGMRLGLGLSGIASMTPAERAEAIGQLEAAAMAVPTMDEEGFMTNVSTSHTSDDCMQPIYPNASAGDGETAAGQTEALLGLDTPTVYQTIPEDALTAVMEYMSAKELLHLAPLVSKSWRSISSSVYGWRAADAICFEDPEAATADDEDAGEGDDQEGLLSRPVPTSAMIAATEGLEYIEGTVADGLALSVPVLSRREQFRHTFPWGRFLSEGAYKQVYRVLHGPSEREEAVAFMDASLIGETGQWDVVKAEIRCSNLVSQLVRSGACPHFVQVKQIAMLGHGAPSDIWGSAESKAPLGALRPPLRQHLLNQYREWVKSIAAVLEEPEALKGGGTGSQPKPKRPPAIPRPVTTRAGAKADAEARAPKALPARRMTRAMTRRLKAQGETVTLAIGFGGASDKPKRNVGTRAKAGASPRVVDVSAMAADPGDSTEPSALEVGLCEKVNAATADSTQPPRHAFSKGRVWQMLRMELCEGGDVEELLREQEGGEDGKGKVALASTNPLTGANQARDLMLQMLASCSVARQRLRLRHYDLKLLNFLLARTSQLDAGQDSEPPASAHASKGSTDTCPNVRLSYLRGSDGATLAVDVPSDGWVIKMADFGTADWSPQTLNAPVTVAQFTTFENSAPELLIQGDAALQGYPLDTWQLGLCFLHVLTGSMPYEEVLEEAVCPPDVRAGLDAVWKSGRRRGRDPSKGGSYSVVWTADRSDEDGVLADTLWRYLVLLGPPPVDGILQGKRIEGHGLSCHSQAAYIVRMLRKAAGADDSAYPTAGVGMPGLDAAMEAYTRDAGLFSLVNGTHPLISRARERAAVAPGAMELLTQLLAWSPASRPSLVRASESPFFSPATELALEALPKGWKEMHGGDIDAQERGIFHGNGGSTRSERSGTRGVHSTRVPRKLNDRWIPRDPVKVQI